MTEIDDLKLELLPEIGEGSADCIPLVYDELRRLSGALLRRQRRDHTLQPTALVHETWIKLERAGICASTPRPVFLRVAAVAMRRILISWAAARNAAKRGDGRAPRSLEEVPELTVEVPGSQIDLLALDDALRALRQHDARMARVVELRFFAGCDVAETAAALDVSTATVERAWRFARAWLQRRLAGEQSRP